MRTQFLYSADRSGPPLRNCLILGLLTAATFLALSSTARTSSPWRDKDWKQWTVDDCLRIVTDSPWASQITYKWPYTTEEANWRGPTAVIISSLAVRRALLLSGEEIIPCLNEHFDDRIVIRFSERDIFRKPPYLDVSGKKILPIAEHRANSTDCSLGSGAAEFSYPRVVNGRPIFKNGNNSLVINVDGLALPFTIETSKLDTRFTFNTKNMLYQGKLDF
jgi:hypothetical protein